MKTIKISKFGIAMFDTEAQIKEFDSLLGVKFNGVFSGDSSVWLYGEGTKNHFSLQFCGDCWYLNTFYGKIKTYTLKPKTLDELLLEIKKCLMN